MVAQEADTAHTADRRVGVPAERRQTAEGMLPACQSVPLSRGIIKLSSNLFTNFHDKCNLLLLFACHVMFS